MEYKKPNQLGDEGQADYKNGDYLSAAKLFKAAADGYSVSGDLAAAAEMANNCSVALLKAGDATSALEVARGTEQVFASMGDVKRQAIAIGNQAAALDKLKRINEALSAYEKSAELLKSGQEDELRAYVLRAISALQLKQRRYLDAYATMRAGVQGIKKPNLSQRLLKSLIDIPFKLMK